MNKHQLAFGYVFVVILVLKNYSYFTQGGKITNYKYPESLLTIPQRFIFFLIENRDRI